MVVPRCGGRAVAHAGHAAGARASPAVARPARSRLRRVAPCHPGGDHHAGHVRLGRQGHRQPAAGYVRGVRVFRDAAAGRLRRPHGGTAPGAGSARRDRRGVRLSCHAGLADRVARGRCDGGSGFRRDLCGRGQLGAGRGDHGAATGVHLAGVAGRSAVGRARPAGRLGKAGGVALVAIAILWPAPARDRLRGAAAVACRALAARLRAGVAYLLSGMDEQFALDRDHAAAQAGQAVEALHSAFLATPYRPTGLSTPARTTMRLVDELIWLNSIVIQPGLHRDGVNREALRVKEAAAAVLERAADLLDSRGGSSDELDAALTKLAAAHAKMQEGVTADLPVRSLRPASDPAVAGPLAGPEPPVSAPAAGGGPVSEFITSP